MRTVITALLTGVLLAGSQVSAMAQSSAPDDQRGNRRACEKRWHEMEVTGTTAGETREKYMKRCVAVIWGGSNLPEFAVLGVAGAAIILLATEGGGEHPRPVSP